MPRGPLPNAAAWLTAVSAVACGGGDPAADAPFRVPEGFAVERAAAPGLVRFPMFAAQDERGRLYVSEATEPNVMTTEEMAAEPSYRIRLLEDTDGDGVFDSGRVFADEIAFPQGGVFAGGALYVSAAPDLLRLEDTDGDGVADRRDVVLTGWTLSVNGALLHGPFRGPDGWLYLTDARRSYRIETREGEVLEGKGGRIWRTRLDGTGLEVVSAGGFDNPVEIAFTPAGETLGTVTYFTDPRAGLRDALVHWVEGGVYPKPHRVIEEDGLLLTGDLMPVMTRFANTAPAGLLRYRGEGLGPGSAGALFSAHFNTHRVLRHTLTRRGATFETRDEPFVTSDDSHFHPTDLLQDADGSLLLLDTGGWFLKGCPLSRVARPEYEGGLYRIRRLGWTPPADPRGDALDWEAPPGELAALMEDPRPVVSDRAVERLVARGAASVAPLETLLATADDPEVRAAVVFALSRIGGEAAAACVRAALDDAAAEVRVAAARALGLARDAEAVEALVARLDDAHPAVRRQAATGLGRIGDHAAVPALLAALETPGDRFGDHALIHALLRLPEPLRVAGALGHASPRVRRGVLLALDQMEGAPLEERQLLGVLGADDPGLRHAALQVAGRHPEWARGIAAHVESRLAAAPAEAEVEALLAALTELCGAPDVQAALARLLDGGASPLAGRLLGVVASCPVPELPAVWVGPLRAALAGGDAETRVRALDVIRGRDLRAFADEVEALAGATGLDPGVRVVALDALASQRPELGPEPLGFLLSQLGPGGDADTRQLAAAVLSRAALDDGARLSIATEHLGRENLLLVPVLLEAFRGGTDAQVGEALVTALADLAPALDGLAEGGLEELLSTYPEPVRASAAPLLSRLAEQKAGRLARLEGLLARLEAGDPGRGRHLFFGSALGCASCHAVGAEGGNLGPDLTAIGAIRSRHDLLEAIVFPSASFVRQYESVRVRTAAGGVYGGILERRGPEEVVLRTGPDDRMRFRRDDVASLDASPVSLMPEGLHEALSPGELSDLMAFLEALGREPGPRVAEVP